MSTQLISANDWSILRVLWENPNQSSGKIHSQLLTEREWSKSTVKTFVSRLVIKGYLEVDFSGRFPTYSCVYTEEQCVRMEMQNTILKIYGDNLIRKSEFFNIYGFADDKYLNIVSKHANNHYVKICKKLLIDKKTNQNIMIHRSLKNLHSAMGQKQAPNWLRTGENYGFYHLAPYDSFDDLPLEGAISYIIANVEIDKLNHGLPFYFKQGLATILSSLKMESLIKPQLDKLLSIINYDLVNDLLIEEDNIGEMRQHEIAYLFVEYLISRYGWNNILKIVYGKTKITELLNQDKNRLVLEWKKQVMDKYAKEHNEDL